MPLTEFQTQVLRVIAANRSPESHIAGGIALNYTPKSARFSTDIDIFHDAEAAVVFASETDLKSLQAAGFQTEQSPFWSGQFRRAFVAKDGQQVKIEWAQDSAFRFFPIDPDPILQWRLHPFDALTNKALTMASRSATRDLVDLVSHRLEYPLVRIVWAACAKDPGFTPSNLLPMMRRHARIDPVALEQMGVSVSPVELKQCWMEMSEEAEAELDEAIRARIEPGVAFVVPNGQVGWYNSAGAVPHYATLGGVVPRVG